MHNNKGIGDEEKTEPKENDKWVENNEHDKDSELNPKNSKLDAWRGRAKQFAANKYHLIIVLLCIILFILFLIVLVLAVQLGTYACIEPNECRTADCLRASSFIKSRSDISEDPCTDFWSYSCKNWISQNPVPNNRGSYSVRDQLQEKIYSRIRYLMDLVRHDVHSGSVELKVKTFYDSCRNLHNIERRFPDNLKQATHELGFDAVGDSPSTIPLDRMSVLADLHGMYDIPVFFSVSVGTDDRNPLRNIIKIKPSGLGLPNRDYYFKPHDDVYIKAYKNFMIETMKEMGVGLHEANRFADEVFNYEKRIAEVTPSAEDLRNTKDNYDVLTIKELENLASMIKWINVLQAYYPESAFPETEVAVLSKQYLKDISRIISSTADKVLNNYYMWRFMHAFVFHSSSKFRLVANYFTQTFEGVSDLKIQYKENWESCVDVTVKYLGHAVGAMYVSHYFPRETHDQLRLYLHKLAGSFASLTNSIPWFADEQLRSLALTKVQSLFLLSGHPGFVKNNTLDSYYKKLRITGDFFQNIKSGIRFLHEKQEEMLKGTSVTDYSWSIFSHSIEADYKYAGNQLIVPAGLFEIPLFDIKSPLSVKYGVLAAHVANKLAEAFDDKGINYDEYGTLKTWLDNDTLSEFFERKQCLKSIVFNSFIDSIQANPDLTIGSVISDIGGVKIAYKAYKQHAEEELETTELPGLGINNRQAFFISYAQSLCQAIRPDKLKSSRDADMQLPGKLRVLNTLQQLPEFSEAFSCPRDTFMNSRERCRMW